MKYNLKSFFKMFMTETAWGIPPDAVFVWENYTDPPSLAVAGAMRLNTKADFHICQEPVTEKAGIADGASMIHCIVPDTGSNYKEYSEKFIQHGETKLMK